MNKEKFFEPLDDEEKQLIEDLENGVYEEMRDPTPEEKNNISKAAENTIKLKQNKAVTLRLSQFVIDSLKEQASKYGMGYQTYMNLFLYQLATGNFKIEFVK